MILYVESWRGGHIFVIFLTRKNLTTQRYGFINHHLLVYILCHHSPPDDKDFSVSSYSQTNLHVFKCVSFNGQGPGHDKIVYD